MEHGAGRKVTPSVSRQVISRVSGINYMSKANLVVNNLLLLDEFRINKKVLECQGTGLS